MQDPVLADRNALVEQWRFLPAHVLQKIKHLACVERACWDDLISEGMIALIEAANHYDPQRGVLFSTYAFTVIQRAMVRAAEQQWKPEVELDPSVLLLLARDDVTGVFDRAEQEHNQTLVSLAFGVLTPRQQTVLCMYFGCGGYESRTMQEVGNAIGRTREAVRKIINRSLLALKEELLRLAPGHWPSSPAPSGDAKAQARPESGLGYFRDGRRLSRNGRYSCARAASPR
jgi:RNA polymerase sigma factor (sigma-70 family)